MRRLPFLVAASAVAILVAGQARAAEGRIAEVLLSSGGLAEIVRTFDADGDASIRMTVPAEQVDDVLKSLVVADPGGTVTGVSLVGADSVSEAFRTLPFGPEDLASPAAVAAAMRGFEVTVDDGEGNVATGVILGVSEVQRGTAGNPVAVPAVAVQTGAGAVRQVLLGPAATLTFADPVIAGRIVAAGKALRGGKDGAGRSVLVETAGQGTRDVALSYVAAAPVWKVAYRAIAGKDGKVRVQGWAVLENATGEDWEDVRVTLSSSNPVALKQRLYPMVWRDRREAPLALPGGPVDVPLDDGALMARDKRAASGAEYPGEMPSPAAPVMADMAMVEDGEYLPRAQFKAEPSAPTQQAVSVEGDVGIRFTIPRPVDVPSGHTLSVPIIDADYDAEVVSLWRPGGGRHPVAALFVTNGPDASLPPGIFTVYDPDGYMGDAQILGIPPGETRYAAFAADPKVGVESETRATDSIAGVTADRGVVTFSREYRRVTTYTVDGAVTAPRTVMIDHPRQIGWDLDTDADVESETGAEARLRVRLEPGGGARVTVTESVVSGEELYLADADLDTLVAWSSTSALDPGVRAAFARIAGLRRALADTETALADAEAAIVWLTAEQDRVRGNLGAVPQTSDLAKTYLARMATLDEAIMEANAAREAAIDARAGARRAFEAGIASFGG
jgi:hypothetical protein